MSAGPLPYVMLLIPAMLVIPALGQEPILTINVNQDAYSEGETVIISGMVSTIIPETPIIIQTFFGGKSIVDVEQVNPAQDGSFTHTIQAEGTKWQNEGRYTVRVSYGTGNVAEQGFDFILKTDAMTIRENFEVKIPGSASTTDIGYVVKGADVKDISIDENRFSLIVTINATQVGTLELDLPRETIDAKANGCQGDEAGYILLIDDIQREYTETANTAAFRTISAEFEERNEKIEVIGTCVVPEFGGIMLGILVVSTTFAIICSRAGLKGRIFA